MNPSPVASFPRWFSNLLRLPLFWKIVMANGIIMALLATLILPAGGGAATGRWYVAIWIGVVLLFVALNGLLVRLALRPLRLMETTARRVEAGDSGARVPDSVLADRELHRLTHVLNRMLDSIEQVQNRYAHFSVQLARAEEAERSRLARELFNDTAQILATALLRLQLAARHLGAGDGAPEPAPIQGTRAELESARNDVLSALVGIRRIAQNLYPPELDELGPLAALQTHARRLSHETGVSILVTGDVPLAALSPEVGRVFFRVLREGLASSVVHGSPSTVRIRIQTEEDVVQAVLEDDGRGFDPERIRRDPERHVGLHQMRERASHVGGHLEIHSSPEGGARFTLELPRISPATDAPGPASTEP